MAMTSARPAALPATDAEPALALDRADRTALLRFMLLMRATEERALTLYRQGKVPAPTTTGAARRRPASGRPLRLGRATGRASCTATWAPTSSVASSPAGSSRR